MNANILFVICQNCKKETIITIVDNGEQTHECSHCSNVLMQYTPARGYIYILSNPAYSADRFKIGYTLSTVEQRVNQLNSATGIAQKFVPEAYYLSEMPEAHEREIHQRLSKFHVNKEFFDVPILEVIDLVEEVCKRAPYYMSNRVKSLVEKRLEELNVQNLKKDEGHETVEQREMTEDAKWEKKVRDREVEKAERERIKRQQENRRSEPLSGTELDKLQKWQERIYKK